MSAWGRSPAASSIIGSRWVLRNPSDDLPAEVVVTGAQPVATVDLPGLPISVELIVQDAAFGPATSVDPDAFFAAYSPAGGGSGAAALDDLLERLDRVEATL